VFAKVATKSSSTRRINASACVSSQACPKKPSQSVAALAVTDMIADGDVDGLLEVSIAGRTQPIVDVREQLQSALDEAKRLAGSNHRPRLNAAEVHARIGRAVAKAGSCTAWGRQIGVGKSSAHEVYAGYRPPSDRVLAAIGVVKAGHRDVFLEI